MDEEPDLLGGADTPPLYKAGFGLRRKKDIRNALDKAQAGAAAGPQSLQKAGAGTHPIPVSRNLDKQRRGGAPDAQSPSVPGPCRGAAASAQIPAGSMQLTVGSTAVSGNSSFGAVATARAAAPGGSTHVPVSPSYLALGGRGGSMQVATGVAQMPTGQPSLAGVGSMQVPVAQPLLAGVGSMQVPTAQPVGAGSMQVPVTQSAGVGSMQVPTAQPAAVGSMQVPAGMLPVRQASQQDQGAVGSMQVPVGQFAPTRLSSSPEQAVVGNAQGVVGQQARQSPLREHPAEALYGVGSMQVPTGYPALGSPSPGAAQVGLGSCQVPVAYTSRPSPVRDNRAVARISSSGFGVHPQSPAASPVLQGSVGRMPNQRVPSPIRSVDAPPRQGASSVDPRPAAAAGLAPQALLLSGSPFPQRCASLGDSGKAHPAVTRHLTGGNPLLGSLGTTRGASPTARHGHTRYTSPPAPATRAGAVTPTAGTAKTVRRPAHMSDYVASPPPPTDVSRAFTGLQPVLGTQRTYSPMQKQQTTQWLAYPASVGTTRTSSPMASVKTSAPSVGPCAHQVSIQRCVAPPTARTARQRSLNAPAEGTGAPSVIWSGVPMPRIPPQHEGALQAPSLSNGTPVVSQSTTPVRPRESQQVAGESPMRQQAGSAQENAPSFPAASLSATVETSVSPPAYGMASDATLAPIDGTGRYQGDASVATLAEELKHDAMRDSAFCDGAVIYNGSSSTHSIDGLLAQGCGQSSPVSANHAAAPPALARNPASINLMHLDGPGSTSSGPPPTLTVTDRTQRFSARPLAGTAAVAPANSVVSRAAIGPTVTENGSRSPNAPQMPAARSPIVPQQPGSGPPPVYQVPPYPQIPSTWAKDQKAPGQSRPFAYPMS